MAIVMFVLLIVVGYLIAIRYFPIIGLNYIDKKELDLTTLIKVDVRDYNESYKNPVKGAINVPVAYLKRYYLEIPSKNLIVVASNRLEKNVGIRFLRTKGFKVVGYTITNEEQTVLKENQLIKETYC
jgi:rhodanese-related sulfurtransferase